MPKLLRVAPEVPVLDVAKSAAYYAGKFGFETVMAMADGGYAIVERDGIAIHLFQAADGAVPASMHIFVDGLDELHDEFHSRGGNITQGIIRQPWGNRDFRVKDEFGNVLKFTEPSSTD